MRQETLCWTCSVPGTGGCSWDKDFTPVDGWEATPTTLYIGCHCDRKTESSFLVTKCPLYKQVELSKRDIVKGGPQSCLSNQVLLLYLEAGYSNHFIAKLTGLSHNTIAYRRRLLRAKQGGDADGR